MCHIAHVTNVSHHHMCDEWLREDGVMDGERVDSVPSNCNLTASGNLPILKSRNTKAS